MPEESRLISYVDDIAALVSARIVKQAQSKLMRRITGWSLSQPCTGTNWSSHLDQKGNTDPATQQTVSKPVAKYIGLMLDVKTSFFEQTGLHTGVSGLIRAMANVGDSIFTRMRLFMEAIQSVLLYDVEVWTDALDKEVYR